MSGKYAPQVVFADWIQCVALSISNSVQIFHDNLWVQREEQYLATMNRYGKEERMKMAEMAGMLILTYEKGLGDVLGEVYMESIGGNKNSGQFFTPYSVSLAIYMCYVQLSLLGVKAIVAQGNTLSEPYTANHPKEKVFYTPAKRGLLI